jgi:hypothetical protein
VAPIFILSFDRFGIFFSNGEMLTNLVKLVLASTGSFQNHKCFQSHFWTASPPTRKYARQAGVAQNQSVVN